VPHLRGLHLRSIVRINVHGPPDRVKDASPGACDDFSCLRRVHALCGACRRRSPPRRPSDIRCHRRAVVAGGPHAYERTDLGPRSDGAPRRAPPSRRPGCLSPPRHAKDSVCAKGLLPPAFAPALSLTPPTLCPQVWGRCFDWALQDTAAVTRLVRAFRECRRLCYSLELRAWS
jgi:hypothetical protein